MSTNEPSLIKGFERLIRNGSLAQGYIFFGPVETKFAFAGRLANFLENKIWEKPEKLLLDALFAEPNDYQLIKSFLWQKPIASSRRTVVIKEANRLTIQAQNAILKIAEEPPASALMILIVNDPESLIGTLASRFQQIYFGGREGKTEAFEEAALARDFLKASAAKRKEIIKKVVEKEEILDNFIKALFDQLRQKPLENHQSLKELLSRWSLIQRYNVNKKLQLESWIKFLP